MAPALDTLEIAKRLKSAGFAEAQAEALTGILRESRDADLSHLVTKEDHALLRTERAAFKRAQAKSDGEILRRDLTIRLGGMIAVATGVLLAAKFFG